MSTIKLMRRSLSSVNLLWKTPRQRQMIMSKTCRSLTSAVSSDHVKKDRHFLKPFTSTLTQRSMMSTDSKFEVINIQDEEDFQTKVIGASDCTPVIVDFHATWCGPCKLLAPRLESIASKKEGKVTIAKVDIDENPDLAMEYGVRSVPTVMGIKKGKRISQFIGVIDDDQIASFVEKLILS